MHQLSAQQKQKSEQVQLWGQERTKGTKIAEGTKKIAVKTYEQKDFGESCETRRAIEILSPSSNCRGLHIRKENDSLADPGGDRVGIREILERS